jgi:hypothetical protein
VTTQLQLVIIIIIIIIIMYSDPEIPAFRGRGGAIVPPSSK